MKRLALSLVGALALSAPTLAAPQGNTLTDIVAASGGTYDTNFFDYDILLNAVLTAELDGALADPTIDVTLFAPNDLAFIRLARDLGYDGFDEEGTFSFLVDVLTDLGNGNPIPVLTDILLYHVGTESLGPLQVLFSSSIETLQGGEIRPFFFVLRDEEPDLRNPWVTFPLNVRADNGRLHTISRVLIPVDLP